MRDSSILSALVVVTSTATVSAQVDNTATGSLALNSNTIGSYNTATGKKAMFKNTEGDANTATGRGALYENINGGANTAVGYAALYHNDGEWDNTAVGSNAMWNANGQRNVALGSNAMWQTNGGENTAVGMNALYQAEGDRNVAIGKGALESLTAGTGNTAVGYNTGVGVASASYNTWVGWNVAGFSTGGTYNTAIGANAGPLVGVALTNTGALGYEAMPTASNSIRIGNSSITQIGGYASWSNLSDGRFKTDVHSNVPGLAFIERLRPVTYKWDMAKLERVNARPGSDPGPLDSAASEKAKKVYTGFIAQEVESAAKECGFDFSGVVTPANAESKYELAYADFVVPLVQAVQEQQAEIHELKRLINARQGNVSMGILGGRLSVEHLGWFAALGLGLTMLSRRSRATVPRA